MLNQVVAITAQLLIFRSGPQDFPYSATPALSRHCVLFAMLAVALPAALGEGWLPGLLFGAMLVGALYVFTRVLLRLRQLPNRTQQTFNALICTTGTLFLLLFPALLAMQPAMQTMSAKLAADPGIAQSSERLSALQSEMLAAAPPAAMALVVLVNLWQFAVSARIFAKATDTGPLAGIGMALLCQFNLAVFFLLLASLAQMAAG